jgi:sec-independent protein translocase protein TatA
MHSYVFLFLNIGTPELMFILLAILLLFGGNKLPELARGLGKGIREFKDASDNVKREIHRNMNEVKQNIEESTQDLNPDTAPKQQDQSSLK